MPIKIAAALVKRQQPTHRDGGWGAAMGGQANVSPVLNDALELKRRQTAEIYRAMPVSLALSFFGSIFTFVLLYSTGDGERGVYWFAFATFVLLFRLTVIWQYAVERVVNYPDPWARLMIIGNVLAGIQWGMLGTWLYMPDPDYRAVFSIIVIMGFVAGSVVPYSPLRFAHAALALPATCPPVIYVFFIREDGNWLVGALALFMFCAMLYYAEVQHKFARTRLLAEMENEKFRRAAREETATLGNNLQTMEHRAVVIKRAQIEARRRADTLSRHIEATLLPVIECDHQGRIIEWNHAAEQVFGYSQGELAATPIGSLVAAVGSTTSWDTFYETALKQKKAGAMNVFVRNQDGSTVAVRLYVTPIILDKMGDKAATRAAIIVTNLPTDVTRPQTGKMAANGN